MGEDINKFGLIWGGRVKLWLVGQIFLHCGTHLSSDFYLHSIDFISIYLDLLVGLYFVFFQFKIQQIWALDQS